MCKRRKTENISVADTLTRDTASTTTALTTRPAELATSTTIPQLEHQMVRTHAELFTPNLCATSFFTPALCIYDRSAELNHIDFVCQTLQFLGIIFLLGPWQGPSVLPVTKKNPGP